jgi:hypothetical protein
LLAFAAVVAVGQAYPVAADAGENTQPLDFTHNVFNAPAPVPGAQYGINAGAKPGVAFCTTTTSVAANVNTDCAQKTVGPHNETSIAINPTDSTNIIGGANDYQLTLNSGGHVGETVLSQAHVTFDGGKTWSNYPVLSSSTYQATGDPALTFDAGGTAYYATLGFRFVGLFNAQNPDVLVSHSTDGGKTWSLARIAQGSGNEGSVGDLLDKEYVAGWGNGNAIVTYGDFRLGQKGSFVSSVIYASVTHDGGNTWTKPVIISGSDNEAFVSTPVVTANGHIFVSFLNTADLTTGRDTVEVVEVSPTTGAALSAPTHVALAIDGFTDYPIAFGRQTYQDSVFRTWAAGNIAADPTNPSHLAVEWSDMRNSPTPAPSDPYTAKTNSDIIVSESTDGGQTWSAPDALTLPGDQFMGWGVFDTSGQLRLGFFDRQYDGANHKYGYSVATETSPGTFATTQVTTVLSDPTTGDRWFRRTVNAGFPAATAFMGDYSNIASDPSTGGVVAYWTDMRNPASFAGLTLSGEDAYFGRA